MKKQKECKSFLFDELNHLRLNHLSETKAQNILWESCIVASIILEEKQWVSFRLRNKNDKEWQNKIAEFYMSKLLPPLLTVLREDCYCLVFIFPSI